MTISHEDDVADVADVAKSMSGNGSVPVQKKINKMVDDHRKMRALLEGIVASGKHDVDAIIKFLGFEKAKPDPEPPTPGKKSDLLEVAPLSPQEVEVPAKPGKTPKG